VDSDTQLNHLVVHGVKERMSCAVRRIAGPPLCRASKGPCGNEAFFFWGLHLFVLLSPHEVGGFACHNPVPRNSPESHLAHGHWCCFNKEPGYFLIAAPIRTLYRVLKVGVRTIASSHGAVAQPCLHAALGRR
jgi:hypothetical protein